MLLKNLKPIITLLINKFFKQEAVNLIQKFTAKIANKLYKKNIRRICRDYVRSHNFLIQRELWEWVEKIVSVRMKKAEGRQKTNI